MEPPVEEPVISFEVIEFNSVRYARGKPAAKIQVIEDGVAQGFLWMNADDLRANIREFGTSEALERGLKVNFGSIKHELPPGSVDKQNDWSCRLGVRRSRPEPLARTT
tara:strand:- start:1009 stop:1332 length:324 start_codon:yes stop_codon:yes gene_type:complete